MLQQPLARRVAGAARYAAAGEALPGALPLSSMRRRARGLRAAAVACRMERQVADARPSSPRWQQRRKSPRMAEHMRGDKA